MYISTLACCKHECTHTHILYLYFNYSTTALVHSQQAGESPPVSTPVRAVMIIHAAV